jgi:amidophosphoribosyltransferase
MTEPRTCPGTCESHIEDLLSLDERPERPDRPEEACGVFGIYAPGEDVARLTYFGLHALQHRGQESAGIAVGDGETVTVTKNLGLVSRVFRESDLDSLTGSVAIGHTRYSTTGIEHVVGERAAAPLGHRPPGHRARAQRQPRQHPRAA